ncbi:hypothetical protein BO94DRAFT_549416 [Aspergillus sclerotioniger CBS 115572]|uniref:Uncharacterized protein n=1 Tax=Aspergillus sclerotioniger CBS 115572 TaxID=1450535 RepID=A0A317VQ87_9EURO|nr:hypothetical protein BO94DRAFT_549416 [Aspergillus sclerotioniger CBS 115572]PWY76105.1 hypothetical protein BO94DRAFT_549416 [Aspergillus sclerotioniger CBS 115572]
MSEVSNPISKLESYISRLLDEAGIPNCIWGERVLNILGTSVFDCPIYFGGSKCSVDQPFTGHRRFLLWVIPDRYIDQAAQILDKAKLSRDGDNRAGWSMGDYVYLPPSQLNVKQTIHLFRKSRISWTFPDPPVGRLGWEDSYFYCLTSDQKFRHETIQLSDRPSEKDWPVKMPGPEPFFEALVSLCVREYEAPLTQSFWQKAAHRLVRDVLHRQNRPYMRIDNILSPFHFYDAELSRAITQNAKDRWLYDIYRAMKRLNELPRPERGLLSGYRRSECMQETRPRMDTGLDHLQNDCSELQDSRDWCKRRAEDIKHDIARGITELRKQLWNLRPLPHIRLGAITGDGSRL